MGKVLNYQSFNESSSNIRVSCAALVSIKIDDKYLLVQNNSMRKKGIIKYGPLGGAIEFKPNAKNLLNKLVVSYERETPDLRFITTEKNLPLFSDWFNKRKDRETSSKREIIEELVIEENLLKFLDPDNIVENFRECVRHRGLKKGIPGELLTERFFEIYDVNFNDKITDRLKYLSTELESTIRLFSKEEILNNDEVTNHSRFICV
jgi:hypothetical protein